MTIQRTNLAQFPESMRHLVEHVIRGKNRRLYSVGRTGNGSRIKSEQLREYPYEIVSIKVVPVRGYGGVLCRSRF